MGFFSYNGELPHQLAPIANTVDVFDGLDHLSVRTAGKALDLINEDIVSNAGPYDNLADDLLDENLSRIQDSHNREHPEAAVVVERLKRDDGAMLDGVSLDAHSCPHFTIEMETGTGKTYVYLRTMLELHRRYGFTKFIVVVPTVAILEGVKKTFDDLREHLAGLYGVTNFTRYVYDGGKPGIVPAFSRSAFPTMLVMTQQSFNRSTNNLYKTNDSVISEYKPYQWLQLTRPVIILDEPQNMSSETSKSAIRTLRPLFVLRYSATHKADERPNPLYRLTPVQAFRLGLVKQVQVIGIAELGIPPRESLVLEDVTRSPLRAKLKAICFEREGETRQRTITVKQDDTIIKHTKLPDHEGLKVVNIRAASDGEKAQIELEGGDDGGRVLSTGDNIQGASEEAWAAQIEETIRRHFETQRKLRLHGVKVLSLFFIDRVANFTGENPRIRNLFDQIFDRLKLNEPAFCEFSAAEVREAYFAKAKRKKKGGSEEEVALDDVKSESEEARAAFEAIMRAKERLISFPNEHDRVTRVAFIFAHSALKEGWDNPNVFQICTLNQTVSVMKKRQEIGRGLRLCVDQQGRRLNDTALNVLTVVANESYESYVRMLQTEYVEAGDQAPPPPTRPGKAVAKRRDELLKQELFRSFWDKLCQRLEYTIDLDTAALITEGAARLNDVDATRFPKPVLAVTRGRFVVVEYTLRVEKAIGSDKARIELREISTEAVPDKPSLIPSGTRSFDIAVNDDLAAKANNPHFRGYKVLEIKKVQRELQVRFTNEVTISESEVHQFSATRIDKNHQDVVALAEVEHAIPDFIGRAADETHLTRATLWQVFAGVSTAQRATLKAHPEGWANTFVRVVSDVVRDHIVDRLRFRDTGRREEGLDELDVVFPATDEKVQRELIDGGSASLYDKVQVDSEVERDFVNEHLRPDEGNLAVYFKFPPNFKIGLPKIIGDYNPDWGILRQDKTKKLTLELVRETKGGEELDKLRFLNEGRKLILAERYFGALGIDYRFVSPKVERYWESRAQAAHRKRAQLSVVPRPKAENRVSGVPVYDLRAAAGAFSGGQTPTQIGTVDIEPRKKRRPGLFVAKVMGQSMNRIAPDGAWCLWQDLNKPGVPAPLPGELIVVRAEEVSDQDLGAFTFKRWSHRAGKVFLDPMSTDSGYTPIPLDSAREHELKFVARFIEVLHIEEADIVR